DVENQHLNTNHAVIGYYTAKSWNLPKVLCDVIAEHHSATRYFTSDHIKDSEGKTLLAILKLAEHICGNYHILGRQQVDLEWENIGTEVLTYLGDRKSTRLNSSHVKTSYAVFCLKKKN